MADLNWPKLNRLFPRKGIVYLLRAQDGRYKIGHTKNLNARLPQLETEFGPLEVVRTFESGDRVADEAMLHDIFTEQRCEREWFALSNEDLAEYAIVAGHMQDLWQLTASTYGRIRE